jgi:hypothetical protein
VWEQRLIACIQEALIRDIMGEEPTEADLIAATASSTGIPLRPAVLGAADAPCAVGVLLPPAAELERELAETYEKMRPLDAAAAKAAARQPAAHRPLPSLPQPAAAAAAAAAAPAAESAAAQLSAPAAETKPDPVRTSALEGGLWR